MSGTLHQVRERERVLCVLARVASVSDNLGSRWRFMGLNGSRSDVCVRLDV